MESLSRRRLRRRDPASNGGVSTKTPYEDVGFSNWNGGKGKAFKARDYAEIFAGSSSIPVFDISSFDERVGSGEYRSSNLDYGDVFGGLRNYDVAVAYEELLNHFNGSVKESNPRVSSDRSLSSRDSGPRHSMMNGKKRVSGEVPDQDKEQFYMPSSGSSQQNVSVSRFSPKYEVSRAWSFSAQVEFTDNKSQLNCSKSNGLNEVNCRSQSPKVSNNSSPNIFESSGKVFEQTKASSLASEEDVTGISFGETSQPFFVEGFNENSPAAVSAAALKKAVDDARERITQAKFMMERRKKGGRNGSKHQQKVLDESKPVNKDEGSDPVFTPSGNYIDLVINAGEGKAVKNVGVEKHMKNVETIEVRIKTTQFTGSKANGECTTVNPLHRNIDDDRRLIPSRTVLASFSEKSENGNENLVSVEKEPEVFVEKYPRLSKKRTVEEKMIEEAIQRFGDANSVHDSGDVSETGSIRTSRKDQEQENGYDKAVENLQNSLENQVVNQGTIHSDDMGRIKENFCSFVVNEVPEQEGIGDGVHSISECNEKVVHKQASSQEDLEMRQNNLEKKINHDHSIQETEEVSRTKMYYCKKQEDGGDENQPELSRTCDQSDEEIKLDAFEHRGVESLVIDADDSSDDRKSFTVQDVATTSCDIDGVGRDEDHNVSVSQETGCGEFSDESIHDIGTDSDLHHKEHAEAVRSSTGSDATTSEVDGSYSTFYKGIEHEQLDLKGDRVFGVESVHQIASENHPESKICDGFEGISECEGNEQSTVIPDASRDSAADVPKVPPVDSKTRETEPEIVVNSQEQTSECCNSSVATSVQEHGDGLPGFESEGSKQDLSSKQEEYKGEFVMVDELSSAEGHSYVSSSQLNSKFDAMQANTTERHVEDAKDKNFVGEKDAKEGVPISVANDQQQRIEAIRKGREREKDRLAVERAIREARERAKEKLERVAAEKQQAEKAATEAKLRTERAAVERATAEVRERAFEKVKSLKTFRSVAADKVSISLKNDGLKHSFSSSDLEVAATCTESAQRRKARLERHQRVVERVAKALEEKNKRDLLVQKEQAERNRMAEHLDADVKRWSAGKEGNLRALLSTLHYILGAESGWKTTSLTEIITTADVKKAYRKATLCVHPDKLQQRGASVQQKYICEKVFDLLKAAWNKFNSEER